MNDNAKRATNQSIKNKERLHGSTCTITKDYLLHCTDIAYYCKFVEKETDKI